MAIRRQQIIPRAAMQRHLRRYARHAGGEAGSLAALSSTSEKVLDGVSGDLAKRHAERLRGVRGERLVLRFLWEHREEIMALVRAVVKSLTGVNVP